MKHLLQFQALLAGTTGTTGTGKEKDTEEESALFFPFLFNLKKRGLLW